MILKLIKLGHRLYRRPRLSLSLLGSSLMKLIYELPTLEIESIIQGSLQISPPILDDICLPPYYGTNGHDDFLPLMAIVKSLQPCIVVELGTAYGNSTANICQQCTHTRVYTVNAPPEELTGTLGALKLAREEIGRVYRAYGFTSRVVQIFKNTLDLNLSEYLNGSLVDLAVIDACHDTDYVINDFFKVQPFVRPKGVVLFHDTHPSMKGHLVGSYRACMMLRQKGYNIHHIRNTWWAIWANNNPTSVLAVPDSSKLD